MEVDFYEVVEFFIYAQYKQWTSCAELGEQS